MMKDEIIKLAKSNKISEVGFCRIEDYFERINSRNESKGVFAKENTPLNFDAKTAIVFAFNYYVDRLPGNVSRYAWGKDYHLVTKEKMSPIVEFLKENGFCAESYADIGSFDERLLAKLSGIAFIGKNRMAINKRLGSYFFIGYILTDCEFEPDLEENGCCAGCGRCVKACPLGAIAEDGFYTDLCLSYISQKKGELNENEIEALVNAGKVWGCDICQEVCPHNNSLAETEMTEFKDDLITQLCIDDMSNREFREKYGERAFSWRGKGVIFRNQKHIYNRKEKL